MFHVGQAGEDLLHRLDEAEGDNVKIAQNLLYAQARRACVVEGTAFLGGNWHESKVQILASWITPATDGFFGCAVAPVTGPAGDELRPARASLAKAGPTLPIGCIASLKYVDCAVPHDGEYSGSYSIAPMDAPFDETAVRNASAKGCTTSACGTWAWPRPAAGPICPPPRSGRSPPPTGSAATRPSRVT